MGTIVIAVVIGGVWAAIINGATHIFLRQQLRPPWSYLFGVATVITCVGLTLGWATSDWSFLALSWAAFAIPGAVVCGLYFLDARMSASSDGREAGRSRPMT